MTGPTFDDYDEDCFTRVVFIQAAAEGDPPSGDDLAWALQGYNADPEAHSGVTANTLRAAYAALFLGIARGHE